MYDLSARYQVGALLLLILSTFGCTHHRGDLKTPEPRLFADVEAGRLEVAHTFEVGDHRLDVVEFHTDRTNQLYRLQYNDQDNSATICVRPGEIFSESQFLSGGKRLAQFISSLDPTFLRDFRTRLQKVEPPSFRSAQIAYYSELALVHTPIDAHEFECLNNLRVSAGEDAKKGGLGGIWKYAAYAACFYGGVAGGGDVVDVGEECKDEWVDEEGGEEGQDDRGTEN